MLLLVVAFLKTLGEKARVYSLSLLSFPKVVVGNPLRRANNNNDRSPTKALGDDDCLCFLLFCLSSFPKEWLPAGLGNLLFAVAVIPESCSRESVVRRWCHPGKS